MGHARPVHQRRAETDRQFVRLHSWIASPQLVIVQRYWNSKASRKCSDTCSQFQSERCTTTSLLSVFQLPSLASLFSTYMPKEGRSEGDRMVYDSKYIFSISSTIRFKLKRSRARVIAFSPIAFRRRSSPNKFSIDSAICSTLPIGTRSPVA